MNVDYDCYVMICDLLDDNSSFLSFRTTCVFIYEYSKTIIMNKSILYDTGSEIFMRPYELLNISYNYSFTNHDIDRIKISKNNRCIHVEVRDDQGLNRVNFSSINVRYVTANYNKLVDKSITLEELVGSIKADYYFCLKAYITDPLKSLSDVLVYNTKYGKPYGIMYDAIEQVLYVYPWDIKPKDTVYDPISQTYISRKNINKTSDVSQLNEIKRIIRKIKAGCMLYNLDYYNYYDRQYLKINLGKYRLNEDCKTLTKDNGHAISCFMVDSKRNSISSSDLYLLSSRSVPLKKLILPNPIKMMSHVVPHTLVIQSTEKDYVVPDGVKSVKITGSSEVCVTVPVSVTKISLSSAIKVHPDNRILYITLHAPNIPDYNTMLYLTSITMKLAKCSELPTIETPYIGTSLKLLTIYGKSYLYDDVSLLHSIKQFHKNNPIMTVHIIVPKILTNNDGNSIVDEPVLTFHNQEIMIFNTKKIMRIVSPKHNNKHATTIIMSVIAGICEEFSITSILNIRTCITDCVIYKKVKHLPLLQTKATVSKRPAIYNPSAHVYITNDMSHLNNNRRHIKYLTIIINERHDHYPIKIPLSVVHVTINPMKSCFDSSYINTIIANIPHNVGITFQLAPIDSDPISRYIRFAYWDYKK